MTTDYNPTDDTAAIVAAYVSHNPVSLEGLPGLIASVASALRTLQAPAPAPVEPAPQPAVPIRQSIKPDFIVCLDDGQKFKSLKRHITKLGYTPESYREKWGLPADYPMVAPSYSATRSQLAKNSGLGLKPEARRLAAVN